MLLNIETKTLQSIVSDLSSVPAANLSSHSLDFLVYARNLMSEETNENPEWVEIWPGVNNRVAVIRVIRMLTGCGLRTAMDFVDGQSDHDGKKWILPPYIRLTSFWIEKHQTYSSSDIKVMTNTGKVI